MPFLASLLCLLALLWPSAATAQRRDVSGAPVPTAPVTAPDDARAVDLNPAALAHMPVWSLQYTHVEGPAQGAADAVRLSAPLLFGFAGGLSVQRVARGAGGADRAMARVALAYALSPRWGLGGSVRWLGSSDGALSGLATADLALSFRPTSTLAVSLGVLDVNGPLAFQSAELPATFVGGVAFRPTGTSDFTLDLTATGTTAGEMGLRGALGIRVPWVGRLEAAGRLDDAQSGARVWSVAAGLEVQWGGAGAGGGALLMQGLTGSPGWYATARLEGAMRPGLPTPRYIADLQVRGTGARGQLAMLARLEAVRVDDRAVGVLLRLRGSGLGVAYAQELREAIALLRAVGKPVVCHLDSASGSEAYACASAARVYYDPAGGTRLAGPSVHVLLLGDLLRDAGVHADFVRIGPFKSAPEQLTNRSASAPARDQRAALYDDVYRRLVADFAVDLEVDEAQAERVLSQGPYVATEVVQAGLADGTADELDMDATLRRAFGGHFARRETPPARVPRRWGVPGRVGVVVVDGDIVDGDNVDVPFVGVHMSGGRSVARAVEALAGDPSVRVIVVRVDSPGGSAMASDQIWRAVMRARRRKPVVASMGAIAASGGYYIASAANEVWASSSTLTGSIGIFFGKVDFAPLARRLSIGIESFQRGRHAGFLSMWRPFTGEERALAADKVRIWYRLFLRRVASGRNMQVSDVDAVARGRVWSGDAALSHGLIDHIGGFSAAMARARHLAGLPEDAEVVYVPGRPATLVDYLLNTTGGAGGLGGAAPSLIPADLRAVVQLVAGFGHVADGVPIVRAPDVHLSF